MQSEARRATTILIFIKHVKTMRIKWLGNILRLKGDRLVQLAVEQQHKLALPGNMLYDIPHHLTYQQIKNAASDRVLWKKPSKLLRPHSSDVSGKEKKFQMHKMSLLIPASPPPPRRPLKRPGATTRAAVACQPTAAPPPCDWLVKPPCVSTRYAKKD